MMSRGVGQSWKAAWALLGRTLSFRLSRADVEAIDGRCLLVGLVFVWLVGVGRYWDAPDADLFDRLGLGSLAYAVFLAGLLWLIARPVARHPLGYLQTLTFVAMTAPPGLVYAIPVEWWTDVETAAAINGWFLAFVAIYRVVLLVLFYRRAAGLDRFPAGFLTLMPLALIVVVIAMLGLGETVAISMMGIRDESRTGVEWLDQTVSVLVAWSFPALLLMLPIYLIWVKHQEPAASEEEGEVG